MFSEGNSDVMCVRYSQDGCLLAAGFADGYVRVGQLTDYLVKYSCWLQ